MQYTDWNGNEQTAWLFANDSPPEFLTVSDAAMGANFDPSTCLTDGTCSFAPSIDFVGADGHDYSASVTGGTEAPPVPATTCPAQPVDRGPLRPLQPVPRQPWQARQPCWSASRPTSRPPSALSALRGPWTSAGTSPTFAPAPA